MAPVPISDKLAANMDARIRATGYDTITAFAEAAGVTEQGLLPLRRGEVRKYQTRLKAPVCRTLGWTVDSIDRMIAGEDPVEDPEVSSGQAADVRALVDATTAAVEDLRAEVARLASEVRQLRGGGPLRPSSTPPAKNAGH